MPRRPSYRRKIRQGYLCDWPKGVSSPEQIANEVSYTGSPIHKTYPSPAGQPALRADKSKCDQYAPEHWPRLLEALRNAIRAECVGTFRGRFPERVWVWINDVLHEARL